jgi:hypothetical protein
MGAEVVSIIVPVDRGEGLTSMTSCVADTTQTLRNGSSAFR